MKLSQTQKDLLSLLIQLEMSTVLIMTACQEKSQMIEMINFPLDKYEEKSQMSQQEVLNKIVEMNQ